jgi:hypothetical protein
VSAPDLSGVVSKVHGLHEFWVADQSSVGDEPFTIPPVELEGGRLIDCCSPIGMEIKFELVAC